MSRKITPVNNKQGFLIIAMPGLVQHALFEKNCCDLCGEQTDVESDVYYESVIDQFYCEHCHKLYLSTAVKYKIDDKVELKNFNRVKFALEGATWWNKMIF